MQKISYAEFRKAMFKFNEEHPEAVYGKPALYGVIVFTEDSFGKPYTETERSYRTNNNQNAFQHGKISNSIWADCLDGKDLGVRLDLYMYDGWKVDYCYLEEAKNNLT